MKKIMLMIVILFTTLYTHGQENQKIKFSGYLETYYGFDFNRPTDNNIPGFVYSHNRHNEVNLNLGLIKANYEGNKVRANLALMTGTYANANLAAETGVLKNVFEANMGIKLSEKQNLWLDAGIFTSHIGFESAIAKDCWALTRNISSENTPYYEAGAKLSYVTANGKFTAVLLYLNGWQRITRVDGNSKPAGGVQLVYKPTSNITLNYSNYLGKEGLDAVAVTRFYHDFYATAQLTDRLGLTVGFDYGRQQKVKGQTAKSEVLSPVVVAQYKFNDKWAIASRVEYYQDKDGVMIASPTPNGFRTTGYAMNLDYSPIHNAVLRLEGKLYHSRDKLFVRDNGLVNHNALVTASLAVSF